MKKVNSYEEISALISLHFKKGVITNCFLIKEELEFYIKNKKIYYQEFEGGLLIFLKMQGYFNLKFYINDINAKFVIKSYKKIVVEVPGKNKDDFKILEKYFNEAGFAKVLARERMMYKGNTSVTHEDIRNIQTINLKYYKKTVKILRKNFDKYIGCIPSKEILKQDINDKNVYCYIENKKILGILHVSCTSKNSEIRHLAVNEEYRGNDIATKLVKKYLQDTVNLKKHVWTGSNNEIAKRLYSKLGYETDGYVSIVLINR